jgi:tellurite resistance protein TerC
LPFEGLSPLAEGPSRIGAVPLWAGFGLLLVACLAIDTWFHRHPRAIPLGEAARWTAGWIALGVAFTGVVWWSLGGDASVQFVTAYVIEWSLSVDNVLVFVLIIASLAVPRAYRHRVLLIGALGAIVLRLSFILGGLELLDHFEWLTYVFGAVLLLAALRLLRSDQSQREAPREGVARVLKKIVPISSEYHGGRLLVQIGGRGVATPLLLALLTVTLADLVFAVDSIPAVFAVTTDPFLAFSSNALAVLGLRSLYFLVEGAMRSLRYLKPALALVLAFVSLKMLLAAVVTVPVVVSLIVIIGVLGTALAASSAMPRRATARRRDVSSQMPTDVPAARVSDTAR